MIDDAKLHHAIVDGLLSRACAPSIDQLAASFGETRPAVVQALDQLEANHGVVLHPKSREVWIAHPFATAPTGFVVASGDKRWWGNCAWCSLGVVALAGGTATITTTLGGLTEQVVLGFEDGVLQNDDHVVHFPVPMAEAWDNVVFTCSVMLLFRSEADVDAWCRAHGMRRGDVRPVGQVWAMAREWYGRHADRDWTKWTPDEAAAIFARHGLDGPTWRVPRGGEQF